MVLLNVAVNSCEYNTPNAETDRLSFLWRLHTGDCPPSRCGAVPQLRQSDNQQHLEAFACTPGHER
jgi:hypothetical protein